MENLYTPDSIRTVSGRYVNLIDPDPATFCIEDIAHALSNIPRFGGHLPVYYSVAHHSLMVCGMKHRLSREQQFEALMHDASEAYLLDIPSPLKAHLPEYKEIEDRMMERLAAHFGFAWPLSIEVKNADKRCLEEEFEAVMLGRADQEDFLDRKKVRERFLEYFHELKPTTPTP